MLSSTVHILLATYNGERFLAEQLNSIASQTHRAWTLTVSDDGSSDNTLAIVANFAAQVSQTVTIVRGPQQGSSTCNFIHLIHLATSSNPEDLYAFCDQDDVWLDDKLARAVHWHRQHCQHPIRLYCGRTKFVDENLKLIGLSPKIKRRPSFGNALVQNISSGNTMVMSPKVLESQKLIKSEHSVWHDWTTYLVATALDGLVHFDEAPCLLYRQHSNNVVGSNDGLRAQLKRIKPLLQGRFRKWSNMNAAAAQDISGLLQNHSPALLDAFQNMRNSSSGIRRVAIFLRTDIRRQSLASNASLLLSIIFRLI